MKRTAGLWIDHRSSDRDSIGEGRNHGQINVEKQPTFCGVVNDALRSTAGSGR
jgi:hypothetical protein